MSCPPRTLMPANVGCPILLAVVLIGCFLFTCGTTAQAQVTSLTVNKCLAGKIKSVGKSAAARTGCFSKEASTGVAFATCHQKASGRFTGGGNPSKGAFTKLEGKYPSGSGACLTFDDQGTFETALTDYAASVSTATGASGTCDAAKIKCVGKYVAAVANCASKAASKLGTIDGSCAGKGSRKLANGATGCLDKAALNPGCTHGGNQVTDLQGTADQFVRASLCGLDAGASPCPLPTPTATADPSATPTLLPPTDTPTPGPGTATATGTATPTPTATPTATPVPGTATATPAVIATVPVTATATFLPTATRTATPTPACTPRSSGTYTDNCNGTVTDSATGLQWEQKTGTLGSSTDCSLSPCLTPHDVNNRYQWCLDADHDLVCDTADNPPDGGAFTDFLVKLNAGGGFAGHADWRLPTVAELPTILLAPYPCGTSPCIDPIFGPTVAGSYWSSTTNASFPLGAWNVHFYTGSVNGNFKYSSYDVRAVRAGP